MVRKASLSEKLSTPEALKVIDKYEPLPKAPYMVDKTAHFLNHAAEEAPYMAIGYNLLVRAVEGLTRTPAEGSKDAKKMARSMPAVRTKLKKLYNRELRCIDGFGVRASVDPTDAARNCLPKQAVRAASAAAKAADSAGSIDVSKIKDPKTQKYVEGIRRVYGGVNGANSELMKLLPHKAGPTIPEKPANIKV